MTDADPPSVVSGNLGTRVSQLFSKSTESAPCVLAEAELRDHLAGTGAPAGLMHFALKAGASTVAERHDVSELWVVLDGRGGLLTDDLEMEVERGDIVFIPGNIQHVVTNTSTELLAIFSVWWDA